MWESRLIIFWVRRISNPFRILIDKISAVTPIAIPLIAIREKREKDLLSFLERINFFVMKNVNILATTLRNIKKNEFKDKKKLNSNC